MRTVVRSTSRSRRAFCPADPCVASPRAHPCAPDGHTDGSADRVPLATSQECSPYKDAMCLTIDKPFYTAFICGQCRNNLHGEADYNSCFEIGGSDMPADKP